MSATEEAEASLSDGEVSENEEDERSSKEEEKGNPRRGSSRGEGLDLKRAGPKESPGDVVMTECYDEGELDYDELMEYDKPEVCRYRAVCMYLITFPGHVHYVVRDPKLQILNSAKICLYQTGFCENLVP